MTDLDQLGRLLKQRNRIDKEIASIIGRPAHSRHIGEFVAARIFDITLLDSVAHKGIDGHFARGPLTGRSVDVHKYSLDNGILNMKTQALPDFYLVLTGPRTPPQSSRGATHPWAIESVFLFDAPSLYRQLNDSGIKVGVATSVRRHLWDNAEVYPSQTNRALRLTQEQRELLALFGGQGEPSGPSQAR